MSEPPQPTEVAHTVGGDSVEPRAEMLAVEMGKLAVDDQVDVLNQIVLFLRRAAERPNPPRDILVGVVVDRCKISGVQGCLFR